VPITLNQFSMVCFNVFSTLSAQKKERSLIRGFRPHMHGFFFGRCIEQPTILIHLSSTGTAFPPSICMIKVGFGFPKLPVLCSSLTSAGPSIFVLPTIYRFRGAQQISLGNAKRLCNHPVAITPIAPTNTGSSSLPADSPSMDALRQFAFARYGCSPTASSGLPLTGF